jgi:hypothetical protein
VPKLIDEKDLVVEYCPQDDPFTKLWYVFQDGELLFVNEQLDPALDAARRRAVAEDCTAWLVVAGGEPIKITPS